MSKYLGHFCLLLVALSACDQKKPATETDPKTQMKALPSTLKKDDPAAIAEMERLVKSMSDDVLNALLKKGAKETEIVATFGPPTSKESIHYDRVLSYDFSAANSPLRKKGGRVGFTATINTGTIVAWREIRREPVKPRN